MNEKLVSIFRKLKKERKKNQNAVTYFILLDRGEIPSALNETY